MYSGTSPVHSCLIFYRLSLMAMADYEVHLQILSETRKKNPVIPKHIPSCCTVRQFFTHCAAIRSVPKKVRVTHKLHDHMPYIGTSCLSSFHGDI